MKSILNLSHTISCAFKEFKQCSAIDCDNDDTDDSVQSCKKRKLETTKLVKDSLAGWRK